MEQRQSVAVGETRPADLDNTRQKISELHDQEDGDDAGQREVVAIAQVEYCVEMLPHHNLPRQLEVCRNAKKNKENLDTVQNKHDCSPPLRTKEEKYF